MMKKLVIISHTEHQQTADGSFLGWGPTVNEINYLSHHWEEVVHIACLEKGIAVKGSSVGYANSNIHFDPIPTFGGKRFWQKLDIIWKMPSILWKVQKSLKGASHVQLRTPMGIGIFLIPYFAFRNKSKYIFWVKYANNWGDLKPKLGFRIQRWMLMKNIAKCKVTMNGFWPSQPKHCISFENPCLYEDEIAKAQTFVSYKTFKQPFTFLFVGRLEDEKGVQIILDMLKKLDPNSWKKMNFVGDGKNKLSYIQQAKQFENKIEFHGFINRKKVHELYNGSHFFLFPSYASEGFPKVIAESCAFGCIPITSNVASIGHYIHHGENGFIWNNDVEKIISQLEITDLQLKSMRILAQKFTFENYLTHLTQSIFQ
jgi:glycosyltransferase involved in cell wall biosynthesis